jgi:hypothetical protein
MIVVVAWAALGLFIPLILVGSLSDIEAFGKPALACLFILIFAALLYIPISFFLKCPSCSRRFLMQSNELKHDNARTKWRLDYWAFVVVDVLLHNSFVCMYCGGKSILRNTSGHSNTS